MNMRQLRRRSTAVAITLLAAVVAACSGGTVTPEEDAEGPVHIRVFARQNAAESVANDHPILLELERLTNSDLDITWIPVNTLKEKTRITLASGQLFEMMYIEDPFDPHFVQAAEQGAFWDIAPYINEYVQLSALPDEVWEYSKIDGSNYGVPRPRPMEGGAALPLVRKDWLDKLGLEIPKTIDELYVAAKAMSEGDPDGNGIDDTYGLTGNVDADDMDTFVWVEQVFTMTSGTWQLKQGRLQPRFFDPNVKLSLKWLRTAYIEEVIPPDFAVMKYNQARDHFMGGKAGFLGSSIKPQWLFMDALQRLDPGGDIAPMVYVEGPKGRYAGEKGTGFYGMYAIPKSVSEVKMKRILAVLDKGLTQEVGNLAQYGFEGTHYTVDASDDSFFVPTEQAKNHNIGAITNNTGNLFANYNKYYYGYYPGIPKEQYDRNKQAIDDRSSLGMTDPARGLLSETYLTIGPEIEKKLQDLKVEIILDKKPLSAWDDAVNELRTHPLLLQAIEEMNEAYREHQ